MGEHFSIEQFSTKEYINQFNRSALRKALIPDNLYSGWPCVSMRGRCLCITIPYYSRRVEGEGFALYPLYCSITLAIRNPDRVFDLTVYPFQSDWQEVDYEKPTGFFKHQALDHVKTKQEYEQLCNKLFGYYDLMVRAILEKKPFTYAADMRELFSILMEPGHFLQYLKINTKFYSNLCKG